MGHLRMDKSLGDFRKGVISFWFRLPQESVDRCLDQHTATGGFVFGPMWDVIPLVSWGPQATFPISGSSSTGVGPMPPSYIGVWVGRPTNPRDPPRLEVSLQTVNIAENSISITGEVPYPERFGNGGWEGT